MVYSHAGYTNVPETLATEGSPVDPTQPGSGLLLGPGGVDAVVTLVSRGNCDLLA